LLAVAVDSGGLSLAGLGRAWGMVGGSAAGVVAGSPLFGRPTGRLRLSQNMIEELARQPERS